MAGRGLQCAASLESEMDVRVGLICGGEKQGAVLYGAAVVANRGGSCGLVER